jgi:hypothetical protein
MRANDSTGFASLLSRPMQLGGTTPTATPLMPTLGADGMGTGGTGPTRSYVPLLAPNALHDGNSALPPTPARAAAQLVALPNTGVAANAVSAEPIDPRQTSVAPVTGFTAIGLLQGRVDLRRLTRPCPPMASRSR